MRLDLQLRTGFQTSHDTSLTKKIEFSILTYSESFLVIFFVSALDCKVVHITFDRLNKYRVSKWILNLAAFNKVLPLS